MTYFAELLAEHGPSEVLGLLADGCREQTGDFIEAVSWRHLAYSIEAVEIPMTLDITEIGSARSTVRSCGGRTVRGMNTGKALNEAL